MSQTISTATNMFSALSILPDLTIPPDILDAPIESLAQCRKSLLPPFSHTPPPSIRGRHRWPSSLESQSCPQSLWSTLDDVLIQVQPYLTLNDRAKMACTAKIHSLGPAYGPLWFSRPWSPNRRRQWGFGVPHQDRTVATDSPLPHTLIHFAWPFLSPHDRRTMTKTCSQWFLYHQLRCYAMFAPIATLKHVRPPPGSPTELPIGRSLLYASARCYGSILTTGILSGGLAVNIPIAVATGMRHSTHY